MKRAPEGLNGLMKGFSRSAVDVTYRFISYVENQAAALSFLIFIEVYLIYTVMLI